MKLHRLCYVAIAVASCARQGAADRRDHGSDTAGAPDTPVEAKDTPMTDPKPPIHKAPPTPNAPPAEDTARYVAWMEQRGTPVKDKAREDTSLRIGDWGFFDHGSGPGQFLDRAGLDRAGHAVVPNEKCDWHALFTVSAMTADQALKRVAWLFQASGLEPAARPKVNHADKITAPVLRTAADGTVTFIGWMVFPPNMSNPMRMTITAGPNGAKLVNESANKL